jgi:hypothetical protein
MNLAFALAFVDIARTHFRAFPEQAPAQPAKIEPDAAVAVSVTGAAKACEQALPHTIPVGPLETDPSPAPARVTVSMCIEVAATTEPLVTPLLLLLPLLVVVVVVLLVVVVLPPALPPLPPPACAVGAETWTERASEASEVPLGVFTKADTRESRITPTPALEPIVTGTEKVALCPPANVAMLHSTWPVEPEHENAGPPVCETVPSDHAPGDKSTVTQNDDRFDPWFDTVRPIEPMPPGGMVEGEIVSLIEMFDGGGPTI